MTEKDARKVISSNKKFEMFLRKNKLIKEYIKAFKKSGNFPSEISPLSRYIDRTLHRDRTPQGWAFWNKKHDDCINFFNDLNNEI